jgi:aromatic-L-amino-acid decarboxylase
LAALDGFEITSPVRFALFSFRLHPQGMEPGPELDALNARLVDAVNNDGTLYLTQTMYKGEYVIRVSIGTTMTRAEDIDISFNKIVELAKPILANS